MSDITKALHMLADTWEEEIAVAYNDYSFGQSAAYSRAAQDVRDLIELIEQPTQETFVGCCDCPTPVTCHEKRQCDSGRTSVNR